MMKNVESNLKKGLQKRAEAIKRFLTAREAFLLSKNLINSDIDDARSIWINTLNQLPIQVFN